MRSASITSLVMLQAIQMIISQVIKEVGAPMLDNISEAIATTYDDLSTKLDETALPRPKQLGTPIFIANKLGVVQF